MKKMLKRFMSFSLAAVAVVGLMTGCGKNTSDETVSNTTETSGTPAETTAETATGTVADTKGAKPEAIRWMVHSGMNEENGTDQWVTEFERLTGIDLTLDIISNNEYQTVLELAFASNTVPDVFDLGGAILNSYASQGAVADLTEIVKNSSFYDAIDPDLWEAVSVDGKIYGVPMEIASGTVTYVRQDWLDRLGMTAPTTYDEYIEMLRAFKNNIEECTVPMTAPGLYEPMNLIEFYQDADPEFVLVNGAWVDGMAQDNMIAALQRMQDAYTEGLIDLEVVTNTTSACRDEWYTGSVGSFNYWAGNWGQTLSERLIANVSDANAIAMPAITEVDYHYSVPNALCISSKLSEEEIVSIFNYFFEYMHDGGEGQVLFESGVEDVHWKQEGNNLVPLPTLSNPDEVLRKAWITPWMSVTKLKVTDKVQDLDIRITDTLAVLAEYGVQDLPFPSSKKYTKISSDLTLLKQGIIASVVMGETTPEAGVEQYRTEADVLGISEVIAEMNAK